jgi:hypothetical protein
MPSHDIASSSPPIDVASAWRPKLISLREPEDMSPKARAVVADADIIFCEEEAYGGILALVSSGSLVEAVSVTGGRTWSRAFSVARARKLAADGWRVVWVAVAEADDLPEFECADGIAGAGVADPAAPSARAPHPLATPFNGLAG